MRSARVPLVAFVVAVSIATFGTGRADTVTAPFVPPGPVNPDVPPQVSAAIIVLREACAAWQPATMPALPNTAGPMPKALGAPSERTLCAFAGNPGQALLQPMIMGGVAGAILFFIGLLVFSLLRAVLISVWKLALTDRSEIMVMERKRRALLTAAAVVAGLSGPASAWAQGVLTSPRVPPDPSPSQVEQNLPGLGNALNKPITGAQEDPLVVGTPPPPSLEALQAIRPGDQKGDGLEAGRADMLRTAALTYGAQGGLAARSFALNELLRRYQAQLDTAYDFRTLVLPVSSGQTLMRPPVVSAAQMAFALGDNGQVARETSCIYQITREAQLASTPPNWRIYLVRVWSAPARPNDGALPRTKQEAAYWNKWVAEGWGQGEKQAVEIFLSDLGRLERDIVGMARYRVLLRAGLVEQPKVAFQNQAVDGGRDSLHVGDQTIRITDQPGLQGNARRWAPGAGCPQ